MMANNTIEFIDFLYEHIESSKKTFQLVSLVIFLLSILVKAEQINRINVHKQYRKKYFFCAPVFLRTTSTKKSNGTNVRTDVFLMTGRRVYSYIGGGEEKKASVESGAAIKTKKSSPNKSPKSRQLKEIEEKIHYAFGPITLIVDRLLSLGLQTIAEEVTAQADEMKEFTLKLFADITTKTRREDIQIKYSKQFGYDAFIKEHYLLPKLMGHPEMTLEKIEKVYPNLPYPKCLNKNANLKVILGAWLPFLSEYSRDYPVEIKVRGKLVMILNNVFAQTA